MAASPAAAAGAAAAPDEAGGAGAGPRKGQFESVTVHPLVLLSATDHHYRLVKDLAKRRVIGVLLGEVSSRASRCPATPAAAADTTSARQVPTGNCSPSCSTAEAAGALSTGTWAERLLLA